MTPERWAVVKDAFDKVIDLEPERRNAALLDACGGDADLRQEVEALLASDQEGGILDDGMTATSLDSPASPPAGSSFVAGGVRIGPYVVTALRGAGSMGEVYQARDPRLGRDVALKMLPEEFAQEPARLRLFEREARAASALNHPNIVTIYDVGSHEGRPYIAMEFVSGTTLRALLAGAPLPPAQIARLGTQIAEGLAQAHEVGIVHRDLKPENIMVTPDGRAKILDFGVAKLSGGERSFDRAPGSERAPEGMTRGVLGTVGYMSPEQAMGLPVDFRSDQFSFGAILYEMAAGRRAFVGHSPLEILMAVHRNSPPPLPGTLVRGSLGAIVERCLKKDKEERWSSTRDLARALRSIEERAAPTGHARRWLAAALVAAVAVGGGLLSRRNGSGSPRAEAPSLAVMPFVNDTGNAEADYLSDGITENVIASLSALPNLRIMARNTVFRYKGRPIDPAAVGRTLGVRALLLGRLSAKSGVLMCDAELVDAKTGARLWGGRLERKDADLARLEGDLSREISRNLALALTPQTQDRMSRPGPSDPEVYRLTLQGRYFWNRRTREDVERGLRYFEDAVRLDPEYAPAHAGIADAYVLLAWYGFRSPKDAFPLARRAALRAISLDGDLFEPHCTLAYELLYHEWNYDAAEAEFVKAIALSPRNPRPHHWYAYYLGVLGRYDDAVAELSKALDLDPLSLAVHTSFAHFLSLSGRSDRAIEEARKALEIEPRFFAAHHVLGWTYESQGRYDLALEAFETAKELGGSAASIDADRARVLAEAGRTAEARRVVDDLQSPRRGGYVAAMDLASAHLALGNRAEALRLIERAIDEKGLDVVTLPHNRFFRALVGDPRYQVLLARFSPSRRTGE